MDLGLAPSQLDFLIEPTRHYCFPLHFKGNRRDWIKNARDCEAKVVDIFGLAGPAGLTYCEVSDTQVHASGEARPSHDSYTVEVEVTPAVGTVIGIRNNIRLVEEGLIKGGYDLSFIADTDSGEASIGVTLIGKGATVEVMKGADGMPRVSAPVIDWGGDYSIRFRLEMMTQTAENQFKENIQNITQTVKKDLKKILCPDPSFLLFYEDVFEDPPGDVVVQLSFREEASVTGGGGRGVGIGARVELIMGF